MPDRNIFVRTGSRLTDTLRKSVEPFQRTEAQRDAARALGTLGLTSLGFGGAAALAMSLRRKNERKLLDEQRARALLHVPVYDEASGDKSEKRAFFPWNTVGRGWKALAPKPLAPLVKNHWGKGLGILGGGGLAVAGLASEPQVADGQGEANPFRRAWNDASGLASHIPGIGGVVDGLRDEKTKLTDLAATIRGEHATNFPSVPWFVPGAVATTMLGLGGGYTGVNAITDSLAKRKLTRKKKKAKESLEAALAAEQHSKLGAVMNAFIDACEEAAPSVKEASLVEWYLAALGAAAMSGGMAGAYNGYQEAGQKHRLAALNRIRHLQLAKRRNEDLMLVPEPRSFPDSSAPEQEEGREPKSAGMPDWFCKTAIGPVRSVAQRIFQNRTVGNVVNNVVKGSAKGRQTGYGYGVRRGRAYDTRSGYVPPRSRATARTMPTPSAHANPGATVHVPPVTPPGPVATSEPVGAVDSAIRNVFFHGPKKAVTSMPKFFRHAPGAVGSATQPLRTFAKRNPIATTLGIGLGTGELGGRVLDYNHLPGGDWKPSEWFMSRFRDHRHLNDAMGNQIHGTHRLFSADPKENPEMQWSWNPLAGLGSEGGWRGFGWRFRQKPRTRSVVHLPDAKPDAMELMKNNTDPSIIARRNFNGRMNPQFHTQ